MSQTDHYSNSDHDDEGAAAAPPTSKNRRATRTITMSWSHGQTMQLIAEVQRDECLWNRSRAEFRGAYHERDEKWREIAKRMSIDVVQCKNKWNCLRTMYAVI